jgi:hypothetical protein
MKVTILKQKETYPIIIETDEVGHLHISQKNSRIYNSTQLDKIYIELKSIKRFKKIISKVEDGK